jgi:hypothetical protein
MLPPGRLRGKIVLVSGEPGDEDGFDDRGNVAEAMILLPSASNMRPRRHRFRIEEDADTRDADAQAVILRIDPADITRVRILDASGQEVIGPNARTHSHIIQDGNAAPGWGCTFLLELCDVSGGVGQRARAPAAGGPASRSRLSLPVRLVHEMRGRDQPADELIYFAPPILFPPEIDALRRLYVAYTPGSGSLPECLGRQDNHGMVYDLLEAAGLAGVKVKLPRDESRRIATHKPGDPIDEPCAIVIPAEDVRRDLWLQDQVKLGHCSGRAAGRSGPAIGAALHLLRLRLEDGLWKTHPLGETLSRWLGGDLAVFDMLVHEKLAELNEASVTDDDFSRDCGGNLVVSPPVPVATGKVPAGGGPVCADHTRGAPFGKLIVGDHRSGVMHATTRDFLRMQKEQPLLPIDTSWLHVGHVDEVLAFVKSRHPPGHKILFADPAAMSRLLKRVVHHAKEATLFAGKYRPGDPLGRGSVLAHPVYREDLVSQIYRDQEDRFNLDLHDMVLRPIALRLQGALGVSEEDFIGAPVAYQEQPVLHTPEHSPYYLNVSPLTPAPVNCRVIGHHVILPRPFGPRLPRDLALQVVAEALAESFPDNPPPVDPPPGDHVVWARPGERLSLLAMYFLPVEGRPQDRIRRRNASIRAVKAHWASCVPPPVPRVVRPFMACIRAHNPGIAAGWQGAGSGEHCFTSWQRVAIPDGTIDVVETYLRSILTPHGNHVHFVDDHEAYHVQFGQVHCGTNALYAAVEGNVTDQWWHDGVHNAPPQGAYEPNSEEGGP